MLHLYKELNESWKPNTNKNKSAPLSKTVWLRCLMALVKEVIILVQKLLGKIISTENVQTIFLAVIAQLYASQDSHECGSRKS